MKTSLHSAISFRVTHIKKLTGGGVCALALLFFNVAGFSQPIWQPSGTSAVYTMRNVGIGTASPTQLVDVAGRTRTRGNAGFDSAVTSLSVVAQQANFNTAVVTGQLTAGSLAVNGNATVNGQLAVGSGSGQLTLSASSINSSSGAINFGSNNLSTTGNISSNTLTSNSIASNSIVTGQLTIDSLHALEKIMVNSSLRIAKQSANNYAEVSTINTNVALILQRDTSGRGVGIGITPSIGEKLSVSGNVGITNGNLRLSNLSGTGDRQVVADASGNLKIGSATQALTDPWILGGNDITFDLTAFLGTLNTADLVFKTDATANPTTAEKMRITTFGNVGIGTTNPQHQLHLHTIDPPPPSGYPPRTFPLDTTLNFDSLGNYISLPIQTDPIFRTLQITNNTTGDQATDGLLLGVSGTAGFLSLQEVNQLSITSKGGLSLSTISGNTFFGTFNGSMILQAKGMMRLRVNNQSVIVATSNGNVGIGTTIPNSKLDVNGDIAISGSRLHVDGTSGNIGIGCTNPQYKLDISGSVRAKEFRASLSGCDFVFEQNYPLLALKERKNIVLTQKHLINVAPAKEMQIGTSLGETMLGILQNVEEHEHYLYQHEDKIDKLEKIIVDQSKIIEQQGKNIDELKKTIMELKK